MIRSCMGSTFVAGALGLGLSLSAGLAAAAAADGVAMPPGKPVQSNTATASSGRRPLAVRIAMADKRKAESPAAAGAAVSPVDMKPEAAERPSVPRLLVECEESTIDARHGETIRWRITIRNAGADAHDVLATLYFAEGIEPAGATGHGHAVAAGEVRFSPVETLGADDTVQLEVTGRAIQPGAVAYRIEVGCRDLPGHVAREAVILVRPKPEE